MSLSRLEALVPPPSAPVAAKGDFAEVERDLGTELPADWKGLVTRYGYGTFGDFFQLWSPFFAPCTMMAQARAALDADRELAKAAPDAVPFPSYPEPGGALPWGRTDNGDVAYWIVRGAPVTWPVAVWNPRGGDEFDLVKGGASSLLAQWMEGEAVSQLLPKELPRSFDPWLERTHFTVTLAGGTKPFAQRLRVLIDTLAPVQMRGGSGAENDERRQVHLVCAGGAWRLTYDTVYGHNLRVAIPAGEVAEMKKRIRAAVAAMECEIKGGI